MNTVHWPDNDRLAIHLPARCSWTCDVNVNDIHSLSVYQMTLVMQKYSGVFWMFLETDLKWCTNLTNTCMTIISFSNVFLNVFLYHFFPFRSAFLTEQRGRFVAPFFHTWVRLILKRIVGQIEFILIYFLGYLSKQQVTISQQQNTCMYV